MKKIFSFMFCIALLSSTYSIAQDAPPPPPYHSQVGKTFKIHSEILNEDRVVWVQMPKSYQVGKQTKYPVLYLLDGGAHLLSVQATLQQLEGILPEMIVVAVANFSDRTRDLTPTHVAEANGSSEWVKTSGGGEKFTDFIEKELIPYAEANLPCSSYRTFVGHSFGGLMVLNTLMKRPHLFQNYLAIDPSLWWDDESVLKELKTNTLASSLNNKSVFISIANPLPADEPVPLEDILTDKSPFVNGIKANMKFIKYTEETNILGFEVAYKYYGGENHGSVPLMSIYDGLKHIFSFYKIKKSMIETVNSPEATADDAMKVLHAHYDNISQRFGYNVYPEESMLNEVGYAFMGRAPRKSFAFLDLAIKYYPESANVYDSMADYYLSQSDKTKALEFLQKAFNKSKSDYHKKRITDLKKQM